MVFFTAAVFLATLKAGDCQTSPAFQASHQRALRQDLPRSDREQSYQSALLTCPDEVRLYAEYGDFLISQKEFSQALFWINRGLKLAPSSPDLCLKKVAALLPLGLANDALKVLRTVPPSAESTFYKGMAQRLLQDHNKARNLFRSAWQLGYNDPYVLYSLIQEDYALSDKSAGLQDFQLLLQKFPDSAWVHQLLGDAYFSKDQNEEARREYLQAIALKSDLLNVNFRLGYLAFQDGDKESAARYFRQEVVLNPNYADARVFLAETLLGLDRKEDALVQLQTALALDPGSELVYRRLATALTQTNHLREAVIALRKAELRFPEDPAFPAQLSRLLTMLHEPKSAEEEASRARKLAVEQHRKQEIAPLK
jgi:tetratricopeptide (TPR) repeat protein